MSVLLSARADVFWHEEDLFRTCVDALVHYMVGSSLHSVKAEMCGGCFKDADLVGIAAFERRDYVKLQRGRCLALPALH